MLTPETETVWHFLREQPALAGGVLIGGSALALRIHHRFSEDLDLAFVASRLPRQRLDALRRIAAAGGHDFQLQVEETAIREFAEGGLDLADFQQNYLINGKVKVSFFAPEPPVAKVLSGAPEERVRLATLPELFKSKCLVSAVRSKTRDWIDLYLLLRNHGFTLRDYRAAFVEAGIAAQCDTGLGRLCSGMPQKDDEGYAHLMADPPSLDEIRRFFIMERDRMEVEWAKERRAQNRNT